MPFSTISQAIEAIANGEMIVVVDDENRENEGDILVAADKITPEHVAFMMRHARGLICVPLPGERLDELDVPLMVIRNSDSLQTAFTVSVDYSIGTTTGISAEDRAATIRALVDSKTKPSELSRPGHIFPLRANPRGVLGRPVTRRPRSICRDLLACRRLALSARSPTMTGACRAFRS